MCVTGGFLSWLTLQHCKINEQMPPKHSNMQKKGKKNPKITAAEPQATD